MKSVCAKHEQAFEVECPWCEKKAEGPAAAPAAPPAAAVGCHYQGKYDDPICGAPATWGWTSVNTGTVYPACDPHHAAWLHENSYQLERWNKVPLP